MPVREVAIVAPVNRPYQRIHLGSLVFYWGVAVKRLGLLCVGALMLGGCAAGASATGGGPVAASSAPAGPVVTGLGVYAYEAGGALVKVTLPGTSDPVLSEALTLTGAPEPVYVTVAVDNRNGAADQAPTEVVAYTVAGTKVVYVSASKHLNGLDTSKLSIADDNKVIAAYNKLNDPVTIGESRTVTMVGTEPLPADIVRVTIADAYGAEVEATKE